MDGDAKLGFHNGLHALTPHLGPGPGSPHCLCPSLLDLGSRGKSAAGQVRHLGGKAGVFLAQHWDPEHQHRFLFPPALDSTLLSLSGAPIRTGSDCPEGWKRP